MARRRLQKHGDVSIIGDWWRGRFREDVLQADGTVVRRWSKRVYLLPATGDFAATRKEAERHLWDHYLSKLDQLNQTPSSIETVGGFIKSKFDPLHIEHTRRPGWHRSIIRNHFPDWFREMRLRDVRKAEVQRVCDAAAMGHSAQTVQHVRSRIHKLFEFAVDEDYFSGRNPAQGVRVPPVRPKDPPALEYGQARELLDAIQCPNTHDLALFALLSGCRISEVLGLTWRQINLDARWRSVGRHSLPAFSAAIVNQWYRGDFGPLKTESSERVIPLTKPMVEILQRRRTASKRECPYAFAGRTGRPLDACTLAARKLKPAGHSIDLDLSWHCFRHTLNTWLFQDGMPEPDRMAQLGHKPAGMNANYLHVRLDDRRPLLERIADKLLDSTSVPEPTSAELEELREYFE